MVLSLIQESQNVTPVFHESSWGSIIKILGYLRFRFLSASSRFRRSRGSRINT